MVNVVCAHAQGLVFIVLNSCVPSTFARFVKVPLLKSLKSTASSVVTYRVECPITLAYACTVNATACGEISENIKTFGRVNCVYIVYIF